MMWHLTPGDTLLDLPTCKKVIFRQRLFTLQAAGSTVGSIPEHLVLILITWRPCMGCPESAFTDQTSG